jgi:hypothetical protein
MGAGLGHHQVTEQCGSVERSVAIAIMAYLLLLKLRAEDMPADRALSVFSLQRAVAWNVGDASTAAPAPHMPVPNWATQAAWPERRYASRALR